MEMKSYKPTTPGRRAQTHLGFEEITKTRPEKALTKGKPKTGGRGNTRRVTSRLIGGGPQQRPRHIDFQRDKRRGSPQGAANWYEPKPHAPLPPLEYIRG